MLPIHSPFVLKVFVMQCLEGRDALVRVEGQHFLERQRGNSLEVDVNIAQAGLPPRLSPCKINKWRCKNRTWGQTLVCAKQTEEETHCAFPAANSSNAYQYTAQSVVKSEKKACTPMTKGVFTQDIIHCSSQRQHEYVKSKQSLCHYMLNHLPSSASFPNDPAPPQRRAEAEWLTMQRYRPADWTEHALCPSHGSHGGPRSQSLTHIPRLNHVTTGRWHEVAIYWIWP